MTVRIPTGAMPKSKLSAHPKERLRNCLVICSPKSARSGARSVNRLLEKLSPGKLLLPLLAFGSADVESLMLEGIVIEYVWPMTDYRGGPKPSE